MMPARSPFPCQLASGTRLSSFPLLPLLLSSLLLSARATHHHDDLSPIHPAQADRSASSTHARILRNLQASNAATSNASGLPGPAAASPFRPPTNPIIETPDIMLAGADKLRLAADLAALVKLGRVGKAVAQKFQLWAQKMGKRYDGAGPAEKVKRLLAFAANLAFVEAHNLKHPDQQLKLNAFSDLSFEEFKARNLRTKFDMADIIAAGGMVVADNSSGSSSNTSSTNAAKRLQAGTQAPASFDWTAYRVVTYAKDQKLCSEYYYWLSR